MQIRVATRQDEPIVREINGQVNVELGYPELDLPGKDADLMDIESFYFWNDGLFIVAEDEGKIVGLAGARRGENDETLELVRLVVVPARRHSGVAHELVDVIEFFAANSQYTKIVFYPGKHCGDKDDSPYAGFIRDKAHPERWLRNVSSDALSIACKHPS
jgi:GNAT superfamily N-acetyltransferase